MGKRLIEPNIKKAEELKELFSFAKCKTQVKRINYVISYLRTGSIAKVYKALGGSKGAIELAIRLYLKDPINFYKTKHKGKIQTNEWKDIENKIEKIIAEKGKEGKLVDIKEVQEEYNKKNKNSKILDYHQVWYIIRQRFKYKYQKPYIKDSRRPENAEEILKSRIKEGLKKVEKLEKIRLKDSRLQNKKTKKLEKNY